MLIEGAQNSANWLARGINGMCRSLGRLNWEENAPGEVAKSCDPHSPGDVGNGVPNSGKLLNIAYNLNVRDPWSSVVSGPLHGQRKYRTLCRDLPIALRFSWLPAKPIRKFSAPGPPRPAQPRQKQAKRSNRRRASDLASGYGHLVIGRVPFVKSFVPMRRQSRISGALCPQAAPC
jgi:hypothetical protein